MLPKTKASRGQRVTRGEIRGPEGGLTEENQFDECYFEICVSCDIEEENCICDFSEPETFCESDDMELGKYCESDGVEAPDCYLTGCSCRDCFEYHHREYVPKKQQVKVTPELLAKARRAINDYNLGPKMAAVQKSIAAEKKTKKRKRISKKKK